MRTCRPRLMGLKHKILSRHLCTVCPVITLDFGMAIWTWRSLYRVPKMLFWWSLNASFLCPVAWGEFKPLIWPLKEVKVKHKFQDFRLFQFSPKYGKSRSWILDMLFIELLLCTDHKNLGRGSGGTCPFGPRGEGTQKWVFAHFGGEKFRKSKFFFPSNQPFFRANWWPF